MLVAVYINKNAAVAEKARVFLASPITAIIENPILHVDASTVDFYGTTTFTVP